MSPILSSTLTVCGIDELAAHSTGDVTHILSILDPDWPEIETFNTYKGHNRTTLRFHDIIDPAPGKIMPQRQHLDAILRFAQDVQEPASPAGTGHLLIHCHMGISRSTAAMLAILASLQPDEPADQVFERLRTIRPQAWPNSLMVGFADELLCRNGKLVEALQAHYSLQIAREPRFIEWMTRLGRQRELEMGGVQNLATSVSHAG